MQLEKRYIYADNSATTRISPEVLEAMMPYLTENYGNPSNICSSGRKARKAVEDARARIARAFGAETNEIFFTSGGTESDNWALISAAGRSAAHGKKHIITTAIEHHAVLNTCGSLEQQGFEVTYLPVGEDGIVSAELISEAIRDDTALVSVMYANNETGTIQPIADIGRICREKGVLLHTDAVQAVGNVPIDVREQDISMMSVSGHKIHAPKGIGLLYIRDGTDLPAFIHGGAQEKGLRAGTENVPAIIGLAKAVEIALYDIPAKISALTPERDRLIKGLSAIPASRINGSMEHRLCGNINMSFLGVEGESLLLMLDIMGICASSGSACTSASPEPSHVLRAMGLPDEIAHGSLRLSLGDDITHEDTDYLLEKIPEAVGKLRQMSPYWQNITGGKVSCGELLKFVSPIE